jgi:hypothetical protein
MPMSEPMSDAQLCSLERMVRATSLDMALVRWSVVCGSWRELGGDFPDVGAFLAGWFLRVLGAEMPPREKLGRCPDSFRVGWREADTQIVIASRPNS